jgi:long-subunit acyl-CoA synthetase (AMP-forming)
MANRPYPWHPTDEISDLRQLVDRAAGKYRDKPLFSWFEGEGTLVIKSFRDFRDDINALGTALAERGRQGRHIAVLGGNSYAWLVVFLAVVDGNDVIVPLDKGLSAPELRHILAESGGTMLFHARSHEQSVRQIHRELPDLARLVALDGTTGDEGSLEGLLARGRDLLNGGDTSFADRRIDREGLAMRRVIFCGGAPMDPAYERAMRDFGITFIFGWGITECAPGVSSNRAHWYRVRSVGHAFPGTEVAVFNPNENGEGELIIRGDNVMLGYYKDPEATAKALVGGWFHSGDCGRIDGDGFIFLTGRTKNVIILSNGKNVYPEEIEMALQCRIRGIAEVVVREAGRRILAEIFPDAEYMEKEGITDAHAHFRRRIEDVNKMLADHKRIRDLVIRQSEFEKTTTKKIKRHAITL